jgi:hypothetical protein
LRFGTAATGEQQCAAKCCDPGCTGQSACVRGLHGDPRFQGVLQALSLDARVVGGLDYGGMPRAVAAKVAATARMDVLRISVSPQDNFFATAITLPKVLPVWHY